MPQVSRRLLARKIEKRMYEVFESALADLKKSQDIRNFVDDLLTPTEKIMLAKRLAIAVLLAKGYNYRQIADVLKLSSGTITAVLKHQFINGQGYSVVVKKILGDEEAQKFFLDLEKILSKLASHPSGHKSLDLKYSFEKRDLASRTI